MNTRLPWWLCALAALAALSMSVGFGYWLGTRGGNEAIEAIRVRAAADSVAADSVRAVLEDSLAGLADSVARIRGRTDTVRVRIPAAVEASVAAGETVVEHLNARGDTAGLRLYRQAEEANQAVLALRVQETALLRAEVAALDLQITLRDRIIAGQDSALVRVRADLAEALGEADRLYRAAHPPFTVKLLKDGWKYLAVGGVAYLLGKA